MNISVALCTYNGEQFLREQLNSILNQTQKVNEIIIVDDASRDSTKDIIKQYQKQFPEIIKFYENEKSLGTIKNFEKSISLTTGDFIFLSDQDDVWFENKVEKMLYFIERNPKCKLLFSDGALIDEKGTFLHSTLWEKWGFDIETRSVWRENKNAFKNLLVNDNKITGATLCFHKELKEVVIPIQIPQGYWHDLWLGLHASAREGLFFIEECLIHYRIHQQQQVGISTGVSSNVKNIDENHFVSKPFFFRKIRLLYPLKSDLIPL